MPLFSVDDQRLSESDVVEADNFHASFDVDDTLTEAVRLIANVGDEQNTMMRLLKVLHSLRAEQGRSVGGGSTTSLR